MAQYRPPPPLNFQEPNWERFISQFETFRLLTELDRKPGKIQVASLKYCLGPESEDVLKTFNLSDEDIVDYSIVLDKFKSYFSPRKNVLRLRRQFYRRTQHSSEDCEAYLRALFVAAEHCNFSDKKESIRDQFVSGIADDDLAEKIELLYHTKDGNLTLDDVVEYSRTYNDVRYGRKMEREQNAATKEIAMVQKGKKTPISKGSEKKAGQSCKYCGRDHPPMKCPAYGKVCNKCSKRNHFANVCGQVYEIQSRPIGTEEEQAQGINEYDNDDVEAKAFLGKVSVPETKDVETMRVPIAIGSKLITFKVDTGADVTVLNKVTGDKFRKGIFKGELRNSDRQLICLAGSLKVSGMVIISMTYKNKKLTEKAYLLEDDTYCKENLLSRGAALNLGIISFLGNVELKESLFGFGEWETDPVKLSIVDDAVPHKVHTARNIAVPMLPGVKNTLKNLENTGVIEKVTHPTDWVSPIVPVLKDKVNPLDVRLCVDLRHLNKYLRREVYEMPTFDDLVCCFTAAVKFSKLDAKSGFYQIPLEENSRDLTTFITPFGRYRYRRLPMGVSVAPEIFQRKMKELLGDLNGVVCYLDDIVIYGATNEEHDQNLSKVLERIIQSGLKLNKEKCIFGTKELEFLGHRVGCEGVKICPKKVQAIQDLSPPKDVPSLRRILGMVNFLARFIPQLQNTMQPLNVLLSKKNAWSWDTQQERAFSAIKEIVTTAPVLQFFDMKRETCVSADASSYGLGGVLLQKHDGFWKPVAFCSRTLTDCEQRWSQIEKECLASVWACGKFRQYILGIPVIIETDHKPLIPLINSKDLSAAPVRCQRLLMRLSEFAVTAKYTPGKYMTVADALSRAPIIGNRENNAQDIEVQQYVDSIIQQLPASPNQIKRIKEEQLKDKELATVISLTLDGWNTSAEMSTEVCSKYWAARSHLNVIDGTLLLYDDRIVIPHALKQEMLSRIHSDGHINLNKSRKRAQASIWWPEIGNELKKWVEECGFCQRNCRQQRAEPLQPTILPERPWMQVGMDLCHYEGDNFLIVVDYYSRWLEIIHLQEIDSHSVVNKLKNLFAKFGIPEKVISDGGPQFVSASFKNFAINYGFDHTVSDPHFPQENGCAERAVQTAKRILKQDDVFLSLMTYRSTPLETTGHSPAQLLMGRQIRTRVPEIKSKFLPNWPDLNKVAENDAKMKQRSAQSYDNYHGARTLPAVGPGNKALVKNQVSGKWHQEPREVIAKGGNRSYIIRNRRHIKPFVESNMSKDENCSLSYSKTVEEQNRNNLPMPVQSPNKVSGDLQTEIIDSSIQYQTRSGRTIKPIERLNL